ncbi:MAG TPA: BamA/TamA family outer membrane protein [Anaeromyxobacteraceae bacterium]|nr:BamA/TamA family outer membrane protein [Anaeromyxobacteraceae bacterium]
MYALLLALSSLAVAAVPGGDAAAAPAPPPAAVAEPATPPPAGPVEQATAAPAAPSDEEPHGYVVEKIVLRGLQKARSAAVRRHLRVRAGDVLDDREVLLSRLRLLQLGWFSQVEARVERGSARGLVVLVFEVVERNTIIVTDLVLGTTDPQPLYGGLGLAEQNFLGRGFALGGAFVYGGAPLGRPADPDRFALRGSFFAPDLPIRGLGRLVAGAGAWALRGEELACARPGCDPFAEDFSRAPRVRYRRTGGELTLGLRTSAFDRVLASWRADRVSAVAVGASSLPDFAPPPIHFGDSWASALVVSWEHDSRNDFFLPRDGLRLAAQVTFASRLLGSDYEFSRYLLQGESAFALLGLPLRLQLQVGAVQGDAPFFDRFYAADLSYFAVGPALGRALELNFSTDSRYDAFAAMGGLEWAVPLRIHGRFLQRAYLAIGARAVWSSAWLGGGRTAFSSFPLSADLALRFDTPIGAFNASLGYALDNLL